MNAISDFFKTGHTSMGIFYPKQYLVAAYPDYAQAAAAGGRALSAGRKMEDVISAPGDEMLHLLADHSEEQGAWGKMMRSVSRALATGEIYTDQDLERAARGAGFLFVHCPTEQIKERVWEALRPTSPIVARHYGFPGIEHLTGETEHRPLEAEQEAAANQSKK